MASPPKSPSKRMVPPPPPIGGGRRTPKKPPAAKPTAEASDSEAAKAKATPDDAEGDAAPAMAETSALDMNVSASDPNLFEDGATARWPNVNAAIASDESTGGSPVPDIEPSESSAGAPRPPLLAKLASNGDSSLPPPPAFSNKERKRDALVMGVDGLEETPSEKITAPRRPAKTDAETNAEEPAAEAKPEEAEPEPAPAPPRLPMPSLLRDGGEAPAADFRAKPRPRASTTAAAMPPPRGMVPPKPGAVEEEGERKLNPGDTASFVAAVAVELMQEAQSDDEPLSPAAASMAGAKAETETEKATPVVPPAAVAADAEESESRKGVVWFGAALAGLLVFGGIWWLASGDDEPKVAASDMKTEPAEPAAEPEPEPEPVPAAAVGSSTGGPEAGSTGDGSGSDGSGSDSGTTGSGSGSDSGSGTDSGTDDTGGSDTGGETGDVTETGEDVGEDEPVAASSSRPRSRRPKPKPAASTPTPKPPPKPKPEPKAESPSELLAKARTAYRSGKGAAAYGFASKSYKKGKSNAAAELMTLAACQMKNAGKARAALRNVPLLRRNAVRSTCKSKHGMKLGL